MKRKELLWMIVPCLMLALFAIALRGRPGATLLINEPFAVVVEKVEKETLKPDEVADGWDTKLKITLTHKGPQPKWWGQPVDNTGSTGGARLFHDNAGKQSAVKVQRPVYPYGDHLLWRPNWDAESERYIARLLLPLAKVPAKPGSVKVQARLVFENNNKPLCPPARLEQVVRRPGEVVRVPQVSKNTHLHIEQVIIDDAPPAALKANGYTAGTRITWKVRYYDTGEDRNYGLGVDVMLYDEYGATYTSNHSGGGVFVSQERPTSSAVADFDIKSIPRSAGALTLRGQLGIGSYWPLKIEVPIRDKKGRILKTPKAPAPFTIGSIQVRPANAETQKEDGVDTIVSIAIHFTNPAKDASYDNWQADWAPHLVDETGKEYWTFTTPRPVGPQPLMGGPTFDGSVNSIQYWIPLSQVPLSAKTVKLKTQIGYNQSTRLPVEVLLRKNGVTQYTSQEPWPRL